MKKNFITIILIIFTIFSYSQDNIASKNEKIKNLMNLTGSANLGISMLDTMIGSFKKSMPQVTDEFWNEFKKEVKAEDIVNLITPIYDKYFTENEIDELIAFYNTPVGKKMTASLPSIAQESMTVGQIWGRSIGDKVIKKLKEKGLIEE
ncbi:DUF2059 domain-containing protein [Flavobacterium facile]|uniref:DUF2059 domain-containing protein n=1 Tax=Flavobacterium facile TaxID=2893174 RepID=UPI002E769AE3|nr:DUF2059 domain-containing protein [Flavobacterium sp. T-12]